MLSNTIKNIDRSGMLSTSLLTSNATLGYWVTLVCSHFSQDTSTQLVFLQDRLCYMWKHMYCSTIDIPASKNYYDDNQNSILLLLLLLFCSSSTTTTTPAAAPRTVPTTAPLLFNCCSSSTTTPATLQLLLLDLFLLLLLLHIQCDAKGVHTVCYASA